MAESVSPSMLRARFEERFASCQGQDDVLEAAAQMLAEVYAVKTMDVALFVLNEAGTLLNFVWPKRFRGVGFIPLSAHDILAAQTVRDRKAHLFNDFVQTRHAVVYEQVRLEKGSREVPPPIQKLISAPICKGDKVCGVVQVARRGMRAEDLTDFSPSDADLLAVLALPLGENL